MCGILGMSTTRAFPVDASRFAAALRLLRARGPDDSGYLFCPADDQAAIEAGDEDTDPALGLPCVASLPRRAWRTALGFRRLAIQDPSRNGHQPMASEDRRYWIVFNGEIYNFQDLRRELIAAGHRFRSTGDTEVLLKSFQEWGAAMLCRLVGMFAIAILDTVAGTLFLARDFFGIKPLFISQTADTIAFSSDVRVLLSLRSHAKVNAERLIAFLTDGTTDNTCQTMIEGIWQLPAAHFVTIDLGSPGQTSLRRYWHLQPADCRGLEFRDAVAGIRSLFFESLDLHLRSDAPLGAGLSGGIDSSAIVFGIRHLRGREADLPTFSYVARKGPCDGPWISVADKFARTRPHHFSVEPEDIAHNVDHLIDAQGEPVESLAVVAQYKLFQTAAAAGVRVVLNGQGADELLAGYSRFLTARIRLLARRHDYGSAALLLLRSGTFADRRMLSALWSPHVDSDEAAPAWVRREVVADICPPVDRHESLAGLLAEGIKVHLPSLLRCEDRNAMAWSVESRVPFLTPRLAEFALGLPERFLIDGRGTSKAVFRAAMRGIVPDLLLERRRKVGFASLHASWLAALAPWARNVLDAADECRLVDVGILRRAWAQLQTARLADEDSLCRVWRGLNALRWVQRFGLSGL